ncbi:MAG TPA: AI-2E family transporter [Rhizomicrobium sp.]|nr:AI-2E family transporter [Rhizomicrobium sp.]
MNVDGRQVASWLVSALAILAILVLGRPLLAPLAFAVLIWAILNALTEVLERIHMPPALAWTGSLMLIAGGLYLFVQILGTQASAVAAEEPHYFGKLEHLAESVIAFLHLGHTKLTDVVNPSNIAGMVGQAAASAGSFLFTFAMVIVYVGFLLAEQTQLPDKLSRLQADQDRRDETGKVIHTIARQVQTYLGVCTFLSAVMALGTYLLLLAMHVSFAAFWALVLFLATYIPTIGGAAVLLPALMALLQFGSFAPFLLIVVLLGGLHFVLANIVSTIMLGRTLDISPFGIILSLSFWGLIWGVAGLFLAVPITGAFAIVCRHIDGLNWISIALAGPEKKQRTRRGRARLHEVR